MADVISNTAAVSAWASYWHSRPMPILEASRNKLQIMLRSVEPVPAEEVAMVVMSDPLLTLQALRFMSHRPRSSMSAEVVSIQNIVMLMGVIPFLERFCKLPTLESVLLPAHRAEYLQCLNEIFLSRLSARGAVACAEWRYDARLDEIEVAAIISRSNQLLGAMGAAQDTQCPAIAGDTHMLLSRMGLPTVLRELLGTVDNMPTRVQLQQSVLRLVSLLNVGWWQSDVQDELALVAGVLCTDTASVWRTLCRLIVLFARDPERWPHVIQPACWLPMMPGEWPEQNVAKPVQPTLAAVAGRVAKEPEELPTPKRDPKPEAYTVDVLAPHLEALLLAPKKGLQSKDVLSLSARALSEGLQMQRIVFAMVTPGQPEVRTRFAMGVDASHSLRSMIIRTDTPNIVSKVLEKPQSLWLNPGNASQYASHMPAPLRLCFPSQHFFMMSIFVGSKAYALVVVDRNGSESLSEQQYQSFKQICMLTTRALTQIAGA